MITSILILWILFASFTGFAIAAIFFIASAKSIKNDKYSSEKLLNQQVLMANISSSFLNYKDVNTLITETLQMIGESMDISQMLFFQLKDDNITLICRNEWINPKLGLASRIDSILPLKEPMLSIIRNLKPNNGHDSCLSSNNTVVRRAMAPYRVSFQNYITTPVFVKGEMIGVIDFSNVGSARSWSDGEISLATLFASTLSGVFEREAMERRTSIVENSPFMIFYSDDLGNMAYANPAVANVTGYTLAELYNGGFELIFAEDDLDQIKREYIPKTYERGVLKHEINLICKNKKVRLLEVTCFLLDDGMMAAICIDLTEKHALEAEIIKEKENAEQASRAKSEFLSNMSHEMRTPMNAIIGMTEIAMRSLDCERKRYALGRVEESSKHLLAIINDILDMSKIEANKFELSDVQFDLKKLMQKAISFTSLRMNEKHQRFHLSIEGHVPNYYIGDDQRLTQVLTNLLSNATKFTPENGKINLNVFLQANENNFSILRFEVEDSGIGISPEQQVNLFNAFEQADNGTTRKYGGTGLGLAITKHIIELMGGEIYIESNIGKGSRFIFTVKLLRDTNEIVSKQSLETNDDISVVDNEFIGKKLLLAEDIEINREILISLLEGSGLNIDIAENGREALEKIISSMGSNNIKDYYDIVFMDVQMPEMDGIEATKRIRKFESEIMYDLNNEHTNFAEPMPLSDAFWADENQDKKYLCVPHKRLPIIAMTANVFKDDISNCLSAGMNDHIGKPLEFNIVLKKLRRYLSTEALTSLNAKAS